MYLRVYIHMCAYIYMHMSSKQTKSIKGQTDLYSRYNVVWVLFAFDSRHDVAVKLQSSSTLKVLPDLDL